MDPILQRLLRGPGLHTLLRQSGHARSLNRQALRHGKPSFHFIPNSAFRRPWSASLTYGAYPPRRGSATALTALLAFGTAFIVVFKWSPVAYAEAPPQDASRETIKRIITLSEVSEHNRNAKEFWVIRGTKVYNITEWVPNHPGGDVILQAAGGSVDPYWDIFKFHEKQDVYEVLEQYCIGEIDPKDLVDGAVPQEHVDDPFKADPDRDKRLYQHTDRPCNAETPAENLEQFITPNELFYIRNHLWVPDIHEEQHTITIERTDGEEIEYTLEDLKKRFETVKVTAVLQCSGNRRSHMNSESKPTSGLPWGIGAIGNAEWTGVRLRDVLKDAGVEIDEVPNHDIKHVCFTGTEAYGASIPAEKAVDRRGDVLLAYEMNGKPLGRDHGYPIRVIVPGHVAARSVKWVNRITLSGEESTSQWQRKDYKCFGPNVASDPDWDSAPAIQEMPVQSSVTSIKEVVREHAIDERRIDGPRKPESGGNDTGAKREESHDVVVQGYAFSGGGRRIVRVDISPDGGQTWDQAQLLAPEQDVQGHKSWSWQRWKYVLPRHKVIGCLTVKAVDDSYNTQPDTFASHYNFRGNLASGWHRVPLSHHVKDKNVGGTQPVVDKVD